MIKVFTGYDHRESIGWHVFCQSVMRNTLSPVQIIPITEVIGVNLGAMTDGTNAFTKSRFLIPYLCDYRGFAIWADGSDMMVRSDLNELWEMRDYSKAVQVVQHDYEPKHRRKYIGTEMESDNKPYPRKNWSSLTLWNCEHYSNRHLTPQKVHENSGAYLHRFEWIRDEFIERLPIEWNWLDEYGDNPEARIVHYTNGIPSFKHYRNAVFSDEWHGHLASVVKGLQVPTKEAV